jgi:uracil-DNA glycosylase
MLICQDWASAEFLNREKNPNQKEHGQDESLQTNKTLKKLLNDYMGISFSHTYATDAFVFIKNGPMSAPLSFTALVESTKKYALPQIEIVMPKMVICLGSAPFNAIRQIKKLLFRRRLKSPIHSIQNTKVSPYLAWLIRVP